MNLYIALWLLIINLIAISTVLTSEIREQSNIYIDVMFMVMVNAIAILLVLIVLHIAEAS